MAAKKDRFFKVLQNGKSFTCTSVPYSLLKKDGKPGDWMPERPVNMCHSGWHVCKREHINNWLPRDGQPFEIYEVETQGVGKHHFDKSAFPSIRLVKLVYSITREDLVVLHLTRRMTPRMRGYLERTLKFYEEKLKKQKRRLKIPVAAELLDAIDAGNGKECIKQCKRFAKFLETVGANKRSYGYRGYYGYTQPKNPVGFSLYEEVINPVATGSTLYNTYKKSDIATAVRDALEPGYRESKALEGVRSQLAALKAIPKVSRHTKALIKAIEAELAKYPAPKKKVAAA